MNVEWDPVKAAENCRKHGVRFSEAAVVLDDPHALTIDDNDFDEPRWVTLGCDSTGRLLIVVWTYVDTESIRLISARKASPGERREYEEVRS